MTLTKSDFEKYRVNEVLARRDDVLDLFSCYASCIDEWKLHFDNGDQKGTEIFELFAALSYMYLDPDKPNNPFSSPIDGIRLFNHKDYKPEQLRFLSMVVCDVTEIPMRARIADVLWLRNCNYHFARLACTSYLETVDVDNLTYYMRASSLRALRIASQPKNQELLANTIQIAHQIAEGRYSRGEIGDWSHILFQIAKQCDSERECIADRFWHLAEKIEKNEKTIFPTVLWEKCACLYKGERSQEALQKAIQSLVKHAEYEASIKHFIGAKRKILRALDLLKKIKRCEKQYENLQYLSYQYDQRIHEDKSIFNFEINFEFEFGHDTADSLNTIAHSVMERIKGTSLEDALSILANIPHIIRDEFHLSPNMANVFLRMHQFAGFIWPSIIQILREHRHELTDPAELEHILAKSEFIPMSNLRTFTYAMKAGLNKDFVAVAHVLPPQLENAFRQMIKSMDEVTLATKDNFKSQSNNLSNVLKQPDIKKILGVDLRFDLNTLLRVDDFGQNLRNDVLHGNWPDKGFYPEEGKFNHYQAQIMYLWWLALHLCFTIQKDDSGNLIYKPA